MPERALILAIAVPLRDGENPHDLAARLIDGAGEARPGSERQLGVAVASVTTLTPDEAARRAVAAAVQPEEPDDG